MIRIGNGKNIVFFIFKPFCIALLLVGLFSLICLRSHIIKLEYEIGALEKKEAECLKERRMLLAERASIQSFEKVHASSESNYNLVVPDRVKVVHIKTKKGSLPHKVLFKERLFGP